MSPLSEARNIGLPYPEPLQGERHNTSKIFVLCNAFKLLDSVPLETQRSLPLPKLLICRLLRLALAAHPTVGNPDQKTTA